MMENLKEIKQSPEPESWKIESQTQVLKCIHFVKLAMTLRMNEWIYDQ